MTIDILDNPSASNSRGSFSAHVDYDTVAQTVGLTVDAGSNGHAVLTLRQISGNVSFGQVSCDAYMDGTRHIIAGPGAIGTDLLTGQPLPTAPVPSSFVSQLGSKGVAPSYAIDCTWTA